MPTNGENDAPDEETSGSGSIRALRDDGDPPPPIIAVADTFIVDALGALGAALKGTLSDVRRVRELVKAGKGHPHVFAELADQFDDVSTTAAGAARALRRQP